MRILALATLTALTVTTGAAPAAPAASGPEPVEPWVMRSTTVDLKPEHFSYLCKKPAPGVAPVHHLVVYPYDVAADIVEDHEIDDRQGTITWEGHEAGHDDHTMNFQVTNACAGDPGKPIVLEAYTDLGPRGQYVVYPDPDVPGRAVFEQWDLSKLPRDTYDDTTEAPDRPASKKPRTREGGRPDRSKPAVVDVMVVFTPKEAKKARGPVGTRSLESTTNKIENQMNRALSDSGVMGRIDIVHVYEAKDWKGWKVKGKDVEADPDAMLKLIENPRDKHLGATAAKLRKQHSADLVLLLTDNGGSGLANRPDDPGPGTKDQAFAVEGLEAMKNDGVSHEMGHNLGLDHDRWTLEHDPAGKGEPSRKYPYNPGWITKDRKNSTIMAYEWNCNAGQAPYCKQIHQFANQINKYKGLALGDKNNDQTRVLRQTMYPVGDYFVPAKPRPRVALKLTTSPAKGAGTARPLVWGPYKAGTSVKVKAYPVKGAAFTGWDLDGKRTAIKKPEFWLPMDKAHTLTAVFKAPKRRAVSAG
ncbi:M12 family metallo-peptidase [Streptomyces sp. T-3]|nr:M12 family metallo-peptidase [Streptomyces sp. T-3]